MGRKPPGAPVLTEECRDEWGPYVQEWYCEPPPAGVSYIVARESWLTAATPPVRMIHEIEPVHPQEGT